MKIGILTFHNAHNYGAVLQAWSLQEYLKRQGYSVEIINLRLEVIDKLYRITRKEKIEVCGNALLNWLADFGYRLTKRVYIKIKDPGKAEKSKEFEYFINHVLPVTREFNSYEELVNADLDYDALIVGSDQVWNSVMMNGINLAYFLQFGKKDALRISYAASIGTEVIPEAYHMLFRRYLREFDSISVREEKARQQVEQLTDKKVSLISDPTFLLQREDFDKLLKSIRSQKKYIYVHNVHLKRVDEALNGVAKELSKRTGLPIIHNWRKKIFPDEAGYFTGGIEEFLGYVAGAEWVVTNSFHCTVFAITYHKSFITVPHFKHPDRMKYLLESLDISKNLISHKSKIPGNLQELQIDYEAVEIKKSVLRKEAQEFLKEALCSEKSKNTGCYLEKQDKFLCYGCSACEQSCPEKAILMQEDKEGFLYPYVDSKKCVKCGGCKEVCISQKEFDLDKEEHLPQVYTAHHKEESILEKSTAGGVFTALCQSTLKKNGVVFGVRYDCNMDVIYDFAENASECKAFIGSKYVEAQTDGIMNKVRAFLENGRPVLFSGTSCQIASLRSYLKKEYENLCTVDMLCHGVSSSKLFRAYRKQLEQTYQSKMVKFEFHNKFKGAKHPFILTEYETGCIDVEDCSRNNYSVAYQRGQIQRPSCYVCKYLKMEKSVADITLGRMNWKKKKGDKSNKMGESIVKINTSKGLQTFEEAKMNLVWNECPMDVIDRKKRLLVMDEARSEMSSMMDTMNVNELLFHINDVR